MGSELTWPPGMVLATLGLLTLSLSLIVSAIPIRRRSIRTPTVREGPNRAAPVRKRTSAFNARSRLHAGVAVFMTACFIIGPEQVVAMHQEAIAYQMMAATGIGQCPTGSATVSYCYDANGSLKERYEAGQLIATYTFDAENRLVAHTPTTGEAAAYTYDADGIRNSKTVGSTATWHLTDKNQPYAQVLTETDKSTGDLQVRYVHGDDLISQHRPDTSGTRYYHYDGQMSTRALSDAVMGTMTGVTDSYVYDAFGNSLRQEDPTDNAYRYTGERVDVSASTYYLRARAYDPRIGRFEARDPLAILGAPQLLHNYAYANNNPLLYVDPSGYCSATTFGNEAHDVITKMYRDTHLGNILRTNRAINAPLDLLRPDIIDYTLAEIGEIKPFSRWGLTSGALQMAAYLGVARRISSKPWKESTWQPGIQLFTVPSCIQHIGFTIFTAAGIIFYLRTDNPYKTIKKALDYAKRLERTVERILNGADKALDNATDASMLAYALSLIERGLSILSTSVYAQRQTLNAVAGLTVVTFALLASVTLRTMLAAHSGVAF